MAVGESVLGFVTTVDHKVMRRVNWWHAPKWLRLWMVCATRGGDGWLWYALGLVLLVFGGDVAPKAVITAGIAASSGTLVFLKLKRMARRRRPCAFEPHCWARLLPPDQFSFPSGHSITAFAVVVPVGTHYPTLMPSLLFCAASVALSRILLGMHFLSDVIAGSVLGAALGYIVLRLAA